jgi:hypothetical protein
MRHELKYLKDISRILDGLYQKQKEQPNAQDKKYWFRLLTVIALVLLALSAPNITQYFYKSTNLPSLISSEEDRSLDVSKLIRQVQDEISKSEDERRDKGIPPMFELKTFELEINFVVRKSTTQTGTANLELVTVDNQLESGAEKVHKIKLVMDTLDSYEGDAPPSDPQTLPSGKIIGKPPPALPNNSTVKDGIKK